MARLSIVSAALITVLALPTHSVAQQPDIVKELDNTPVTMFEFGMHRMRLQLSTWADKWADEYWDHHTELRGGVDINARYDPKDHRIYVTVSATHTRGTEALLEKGCEEALTPVIVTISKGIPGFFLSRNQLSSRVEFEGKRKALLEMIEISCVVYGTGSNDVRYRRIAKPKS